jgi:hypothetical protein
MVVTIKIITFWDTVIFRINKLSYLMARRYLNFRLGLINFYADSSELLKTCDNTVIVYQTQIAAASRSTFLLKNTANIK